MRLIKEELRANTVALTVSLCSAILFAALLFRFNNIIVVLSRLLNILLPLILGAVLAMLLSPVMHGIGRLIGRILCRKKDRSTLANALSLVLTFIFLALFLVGVVSFVMPQVLSSVISLMVKAENYLRSNAGKINDVLNRFGLMEIDITSVLGTWESMAGKVLQYSSKAVMGIVNFSVGLGTRLAGLLMSVVLSGYLLTNSGRFAAQGKKTAYALLKEEKAEKLIYWMRRSHAIFSGYITGKILDSLIIGVLCYLGMLIFRLDYPLLISVTVCVTNVLPYFGPIIGGAIGCLILLIINPIQALWFFLFVLVLQQIDGNFIGPLIVGDSVGMSSFWIMLAIMIGGGLWGLYGMLVSIPLFALVYAMVKASLEVRLNAKGMPVETEAYITRPEEVKEKMQSKRKEIKRKFRKS